MGKQWKQWLTLFWGAPKSLQMVTAAMRLVMTNLDSILKSRDITVATEVHQVKAMVFPAVMYGYESWTIKKAEHQRIDAFELWCWRRLLRIPWTARRSNQSILKEIRPGCSLEGLMLKLKLQDFGHLMQRADSLEKTLILGKIEGRRRRGQQWMRWLDGITKSMYVSLSELLGLLISFRMDLLDVLAVQGTLKSLLQHHSSKASILWHSAFFTVQLSHPYMTTGKTVALTR